MSEKEFVKGLFVNPPHERAPDFVKCGISFRPAEFIEWLQAQTPNDKGYVRPQVKEGKSGKWYAEVDSWKPDAKKPDKKPEPRETAEFVDDDIPF